MRGPLRRGAVTVALATTLTLAFPAVAHAATWDFMRGPTPREDYGYGETKGTITFTGPKSLEWIGITKDICPPDGLGTSFYFEIDYPSGATDLTLRYARDSTGCSDGFQGGDSGVRNSAKKIVRVRVFLCMTNGQNDCWAVYAPGGAWKVNPYA